MREMNWVWAVGAPLVRAIMSVCVPGPGRRHRARAGAGAVVVAPNHVSVLDGPAVSAITGTAPMARHPQPDRRARSSAGVIGWILRQARQIPIRRGSGDTGALDDAIGAVRGRMRASASSPRAGSATTRVAGCSASARGSPASRCPPAPPSCPWASGARIDAGRRDGLDARALLRRPRDGGGLRRSARSRARRSRPPSSANAIAAERSTTVVPRAGDDRRRSSVVTGRRRRTRGCGARAPPSTRTRGSRCSTTR